MKKLFFFCVLILSSIACSQQTANPEVPDYEEEGMEVFTSKVSGVTFSSKTVNTDRLIVKFKDSFVSKIEACSANASLLATSVKSEENPIAIVGTSRMERVFPDAGRYEERTRAEGLHRWYYVDYAEDLDIVDAESLLNNCSAVEIVEYELIPREIGNIIERHCSIPSPRSYGLPFNDPQLPSQWSYYNDGAMTSSMEGCDINVFPAWRNYPKGEKDVIVAVVDGIVDSGHPDLEANMWTSEDGSHGKNFVNGGKNVPSNHGTHVAGTVAAVNNNALGVCGVAGGDYANGIPGAKIMSCGIFDETVAGSSSGSGASAIKWAADHGAVIAQNSWGYDPDTDGDGKLSEQEINSFKAKKIPSDLKEAIDYFIKYAGCDENGEQLPDSPMKGGIVIFAAGNSNLDYDTICSYDKVLSVAALAPDYRKAYYSCYGDWVDVSAPGGDAYKDKTILSTIANGEYGYMQGSSMACPHVSGIAALLLGRYQGQGFTCEMLREIICSSTVDIAKYNVSYPSQLGKGLVNTALAMSYSEEVPGEVEGFSYELNSNSALLSWMVPSDEPVFAYHIFISKSSLSSLDPSSPSQEVKIIEIKGSDCVAGSLMNIILDDLEFCNDYYVRIAAVNYLGEHSALSQELILSVGANNPPIIEAPTCTDIVSKAHEEPILDFKFYDPDGHKLTCRLTPDHKAVSLLVDNGVATVTVKAMELEQGASYSFNLEVCDGYDTTVQPFTITVLENHAPVIKEAIPNIVLNGMEDNCVIDLSKHFSDEDGEELEYSLIKKGTTVVKVSVAGNNLNIKSFAYGSCEYSIQAKDACGLQSDFSFSVLVRDDSRPVDLYPNPVTDKLNIRSPEEGKLKVLITNRAGALVFKDEEAATGPFTPFVVDMTELPKGEYYVKTEGLGADGIYSVIKM
ncbi:MAG: S8 family serine peptidase [Bacteroidales bacterium]|nr:S8 family serine peptidase [Bacteroidales bacterium]